jgi:tetratricopeptide (TPR) repeat protein
MTDREGRWDEQLELGRRAFEEGDHEIAETALIRALAEARQLGDDDPRLAGTLDTLGMLYYAQGRCTESAPLLEEALRIFEHRIGHDHLTTAATLNNLAQVYEEIGRTSDAESLYQRALGIRERSTISPSSIGDRSGRSTPSGSINARSSCGSGRGDPTIRRTAGRWPTSPRSISP